MPLCFNPSATDGTTYNPGARRVPNPICPVHQTEKKWVPEGVGKKGKYPAFWSCTVYGCKGKVPEAVYRQHAIPETVNPPKPDPVAVQPTQPELPASPDQELRLRAALGALEAAVRLSMPMEGCEPSTVLTYANSFYYDFLAPIAGLTSGEDRLEF